MINPFIFFNTIRYLKSSQALWRLYYRIYRPSIDNGSPPALRTLKSLWRGPTLKPCSMLAKNQFRFLNEVHLFESQEDWNRRDWSKLWLYNLHYFDDLIAVGTKDRAEWHQASIDHWIAESPAGEGVGWEPYPLSRRIVNWIKWALADNNLSVDCLHSLAVQIRYLQRRLERHLLGNHLIANAKALVFSGLYYEGAEADVWRTTGLNILAQQLPEQILSDGGHFELSPMYHAIVLEDLLDLINLASAYAGVIPDEIIDGWATAAQRMRVWLTAMSHTDGEIAFFNDAAFGIAAPPAQLEAYAKRLGLEDSRDAAGPVTALGESGYVRVALGEMLALLDVAAVGPDYQPGHAHADSLSFELSLSGRRVLVNSGTSLYGLGPERSRQRSTAAHNTVEVDGENSSEVWSGFRVARRARPFGLRIDEEDGDIVVRCAHDGYRRLPGRVTHWREWRFEERSLSVKDTIDGQHRTAVARFHLHPDVKAEGGESEGRLMLEAGRQVRWQISGGSAKLRPITWHPEFGTSVAGQCLEIAIAGPECTTTFAW